MLEYALQSVVIENISRIEGIVSRYLIAIRAHNRFVLTNIVVHGDAARRDNPAPMAPAPTDEDYRRLLQLRTGLRRFLRWSERQAQAAGLTPAQHQLLLAVRGHPDPRGPTVGDVAAYLLLRHHSAVGLVDRAEAAGLLNRRQDHDNLSAVRLRLTDEGSRQLEALSELHLDELAHLAPAMHALWEALERDGDGRPRRTPHPAAPPRDPAAPLAPRSPRPRRSTRPVPIDPDR